MRLLTIKSWRWGSSRFKSDAISLPHTPWMQDCRWVTSADVAGLDLYTVQFDRKLWNLPSYHDPLPLSNSPTAHFGLPYRLIAPLIIHRIHIVVILQVVSSQFDPPTTKTTANCSVAENLKALEAEDVLSMFSNAIAEDAIIDAFRSRGVSVTGVSLRSVVTSSTPVTTATATAKVSVFEGKSVQSGISRSFVVRKFAYKNRFTTIQHPARPHIWPLEVFEIYLIVSETSRRKQLWLHSSSVYCDEMQSIRGYTFKSTRPGSISYSQEFCEGK